MLTTRCGRALGHLGAHSLEPPKLLQEALDGKVSTPKEFDVINIGEGRFY